MRNGIGLVVALALAACSVGMGCKARGDLPAEQAETLIRESGARTPNMTCGLKEPIQEEGSGANRTYALHETEVRQQRCVLALQAAGFIKDVRPEGGGRVRFALTASSSWNSGHVALVCGTRSDYAIQSVTTEGNRARAKYTRKGTVDVASLDKLTECTVDRQIDGTSTRDATFTRDDAGRWTLTTW